ncbi:oocyte zinc finger protein XlCOF6-like [Littorina saxatilis]|uniref:oocyte zinc finger protein XlCOF6-like n=1 Tax=Littorina saxatilis TaxID=31220 RepID=UPI0038B5480B
MSFAQKPSGSGLKKKSEKAPQKRVKLRKKAITELDVRSENDSDADYLPCGAQQTNNAPEEGIQHYMAEHQQKDVGASFSSHKPAHAASAQRLPREKGASISDQNYVMSTGSASTGAFFMGPSHTQQTLYAEYCSAYTRQQQHDSHQYAHHVPEFYPSSISSPHQRSNMVIFQDYSNRPTQALSAGHHAESEGYREQNQPMNRLPHPQSVSASTSSNPHLVPHAMQSSAEASLNSKTDHVSAPEADCKNIVFDSNPDNQCRICEEKFLSTMEYENHQKDVSRFDAVECKRCKCTFHGLHELNLHVFSQHETEKRGFCFTCDHDALGMEDLERHVHIHAYNCERTPADLRFHDCQTCGEELLNSYTDVHVHYYQHHATHICSSCYQTFEDVQAYKDHHNQTYKGKAILCSICGSKFESVEDLDEHTPCSEDIWAEDGKGESCFKCGKWCPNRSVVEAHKKQHRSQEDVEAYREGAKVGFPCPSCEKVFKNKHACRRHAKMVHEGVSCYKHYCEYCGKGFLTKGHMRDHIALHHLKIKRYKCDYCDKQFVCGPTLRRHVRMEHTKYKPYQCPHCDERFFEKTPLQRHLTVHTGLAPFMCEHCGKGFYTRHSFRNHSSTHSTVKEFVCSGCQKGFTRKYNLLAHNKICKML